MTKHLLAILIGIVVAGIVIECVQRHLQKKRISTLLDSAETELRCFAKVVAAAAMHDTHNGLLLAQLFERAATDLKRVLDMREYATAKQYPEIYKKAQMIQGNIAALYIFFHDGLRNHTELPDFASTLFQSALSAEIHRTEELPLLCRRHRDVLSRAKQLIQDFSMNKNALSAEELRMQAAQGLYHLVLLRNNKFFF